jgi:uncharacterized protein with GYD domain
MSKYLFAGSYSPEGGRGVLKEGGTRRRKAAEQVVSSVGGTLESFYFAFGGDDFYLIADLPDHTAAAAASLVVNASGAVSLKTTVLLTPDELDAAAQRSVQYSPPRG